MMIRLRYVFVFAAIVFAAQVTFGWFFYRKMALGAYEPQLQFDAQAWAANPLPNKGASDRQLMLRDLVVNVLPGAYKTNISRLMPSPTREQMRRRTLKDLAAHDRTPDGALKDYPRTGAGYYGDEFDWDLSYIIGYEQTLWDRYPERRMEELYIRFDRNGKFMSWYIDGSDLWPTIVGDRGKQTYKRTR